MDSLKALAKRDILVRQTISPHGISGGIESCMAVPYVDMLDAAALMGSVSLMARSVELNPITVELHGRLTDWF
jgi:hypothetical protein